MFKVHCVACRCQRKASEENGAQVLVSGFKLGLKITRRTSEMIEREQINVLCQVCNVESRTTITFGDDTEHPEDFFLRCPNCDNTESGSLPAQTFDTK